jgi:hypothetical protein
MLKRPYTSSIKCIENDSEAYMMPRDEFLRMFKINEEAWRVMYATASEKEQFLFNRCFNFVAINREDERVRR